MDLTALTLEDLPSLADNSRIFSAGLDYERSDMISRFAVTPTGITARVHGNYGEYTVTVTPDVKLRCTCPCEGTTCKHKIAVLLRYLEGDYSQLSTPCTEERVRSLVADAVKAEMPEESLVLYDALVQANINLFHRGGYAEAARYAAEVAHIYRSIVNDPAEAKKYVADIRARYPRHRALQEEFARL